MATHDMKNVGIELDNLIQVTPPPCQASVVIDCARDSLFDILIVFAMFANRLWPDGLQVLDKSSDSKVNDLRYP